MLIDYLEFWLAGAIVYFGVGILVFALLVAVMYWLTK